MVGSPRRYADLAWETHLRSPQVIRLRLPDGFGVYALHEGVSARCSGMFYQAGFGFSVDTVTFRDLLEREVTDFPAAEYDTFRAFTEERSQTAAILGEFEDS